MTEGSSHIFTRATDRPLAVHATGRTVLASDGKHYLDGAGGAIANSIGHGHPAVVAAMAEQAASVDYVHATQFGSLALERYTDAVAPLVPIDDVRIFPVSGGSEANETAFKLARAYHLARGEDRHLIAARHGAYHGNTRGVLDASDRPALSSGYEPWIGQTVRVPMANPYRDTRSGAEIVAETEDTLRSVGIESVAAFIAEPVSGATLGAMVPPDDYWPALADMCRRHGILLIADEVMTGFGRTGKWFACEHWGVRPDIITAGKGASSGYWPLGLCMASGEIFDTVERAANFVHGFTWSHHPIGAAVANAVLGVLKQEYLVDTAGPKGEHLRSLLTNRLGDHPNVGDIRGLGLLCAVEFVADRATKAPFDQPGTAQRVTDACFDHALTVYPCGSAVDGAIGDAVLIGPPLSVTTDELTEMADRLAAGVADALPIV
ncbi:MAG: aminotransferase class III-fold pyridoxal phosphate-dependent enzyme [Acidimicrobiales bacterium]